MSQRRRFYYDAACKVKIFIYAEHYIIRKFKCSSFKFDFGKSIHMSAIGTTYYKFFGGKLSGASKIGVRKQIKVGCILDSCTFCNRSYPIVISAYSV